jgi:bifunctional non-homologous end joining protein LigD
MGEKCVGEWTLVRLRGERDKAKTSWLIIKNSGQQHAARMTGKLREVSVLTGRTQDEIAGVGSALAPEHTRNEKQSVRRQRRSHQKVAAAAMKSKSEKPKKKAATSRVKLAPARFIPPMKAVSVDAVPEGKWRLEIKLDGYRAIAVLNDGAVELWSRNHKPLTEHYPEVVEALKKVPCRNAVIDGEIVALDAEGRSRFQLMQRRDAGEGRPPIVYYVFDLLHHDGRSRLNEPIEERQTALEVLVGKKSKIVRFSPVFETDPATMLEAVRKQGLEGIIAKAPGSIYEPDRRSGAWLKAKVFGEQEFVIGGFTPPKNSRLYLGALLVGYYEGKELIYAGKVGSGFDRQLLASLHREFLKRRVDRCPFANLPQARKPRYGLGMTASAMREVTWIKPELVAQIRFAEWTNEGSLRQPVFLGLRRDKSAKDVVREAAPVKDAS